MAVTKTISFKETVEDIKLYNWICSKSSCSCFIKDILREYMIQEQEKKTQKK